MSITKYQARLSPNSKSVIDSCTDTFSLWIRNKEDQKEHAPKKEDETATNASVQILKNTFALLPGVSQ